MDTSDDIVISGVSGRFPQSDNYQQLADNLLSGLDVVTCDNTKWTPGLLDVPSRTGKLKKFSKFDPAYFGIVRWQCTALDPITRHCLECAYEAVLDAGLNAADLKGTNTNVYFGSTLSEAELLLVHEKARDGYSIMGRNRALNANRISYWLDLKGTSHAYDATWCNGLHGIQLAYNAIKNGQCDTALVGTASLMIHPQPSVQYQDLNLLSADGVTRVFDADADGYARSESINFFIIQRSKVAKRSYGSIVHVLSKCYGDRNEPLIQPSAQCWKQLLTEFYQECRIDRNLIEFLEADAAGFKHGDSIEMEAVTDVICTRREEYRPLLIGSVKSNMGHTEAAAASCSLAKAIVTMESGYIPPNLHYKRPNPRITGLQNGLLQVVTKKSKYNGGLVAINSSGLCGTYAHIVLRPNPRQKPIYQADIPRLVLLSGRTEEGVNEGLQTVEDLPFDPEYYQLINDVSSKNVVRHLYRGYTLVPKSSGRTVGECKAFSGEQRPIWFVFAGMGSQWPGMARDLMALPVFREAIDECHEVLLTKGLDLKDIITRDDPTLFENILHCFIGIAAVQIGLVDVLNALGIVPDGLIGHSVGEMAAAYGDGCFTRKQMILSSYSRGKASVNTPVIKGMMAAIGMGYNQIKDQLPPEIEVACHNGPDSCTLSGPTEMVEKYVSNLKARGVFARTINVANIAYHSQHIAKMGPKFYQYLSEVIPERVPRSKKWISTSVPESEWELDKAKYSSPEYHTNNLLGQVLFEEGCRHIPADAITIEIAPHGLLQAILKRSLGKNCINIPLTNKNASNQLQFLLQAVGKMYTVGLQPQLSGLYPRHQYPVTRGTPPLAPLSSWQHSEDWLTGVDKHAGRIQGGREYVLDLQQEHSDMFSLYKFGDSAAVPISTYLTFAWEVFSSLKSTQLSNLSLCFEDVSIRKVVYLQPTDINLKFFVMVTPGDGHFEVTQDDDVIITGRIVTADVTGPFADLHVCLNDDEVVIVDKKEVYSDLEYFGHFYSSDYRNIKSIVVMKEAWRALIDSTTDLASYVESLLQLQTLQESELHHKLVTPTYIRKLEIHATALRKKQHDEVYLDSYTKVIKSDAVQLCGVELKEMTTDLSPQVRSIQDADLQLRGYHWQVVEELQDQTMIVGYLSEESNKMGLAWTSSRREQMTMDEVLVWNQPKTWLPSQAASVPYNYCMAYLCLYTFGHVRDEDTVLVSGSSSPVDIAVLNVLARKSCRLLTCVKSVEDKVKLLKTIPLLNDNNILLLTDNEDQLRAEVLERTDGEGVTLIISSSVGEQFHCVMNCWRNHTRMIQLTQHDMTIDNNFYTRNFTKNSSLIGLSPARLLTLTEVEKLRIKSMIDDGIHNGVILPGDHLHSCSRPTREKKMKKDSDQNQNHFTCDPNKSYLIIGGDSNIWFQTIEWLNKNQARSIIIGNTGEEITKNTQRRLNLLRKTLDINIVVKLAEENKVSITNLFNETCNIANIGLVFLIPREKMPVELLTCLDTLCRQKNCFLVSVLEELSDGAEFCKERHERDDPLLTVVRSNKGARYLAEKFDSMFAKHDQNVVHCLTMKDASATKEEQYCVTSPRMIPNTLKELAAYTAQTPNSATITELTTNSVNFEYVKDLYPLILLPSFNQNSLLNQSANEFMYPAFKITLPYIKNCTIGLYASLAFTILKSRIRGPYILVGEDWNGLIALELAYLLEKDKEKVQLFLISGTSYEVHKNIQLLGTCSEEIERNLIRILNESKDPEVEKCLPHLAQKESQVFRLGVTQIINQLEAGLSYTCTRQLTGSVVIVTTQYLPPSVFKQICCHKVKVHTLFDQEYNKETVLDIIHNETLITKFEK